MKRSTMIWLDDLRDPADHLSVADTTIIWLKDYRDFTSWITQHGVPDFISFDHDLADEHYVPEQYWGDPELDRFYQEKQIYTEKTGYDCAKWLVNFCEQAKVKLPDWNVHSQNPIGKENIENFLKNAKKHLQI